jgi:hypothetical protein
MTEPTGSGDVIHRLKNHIAIIVGFSELLIADSPEGEQRRADLVEVHNAALAAMAMMPEVESCIRR